MADKEKKKATFAIGRDAKREVRRALVKSSDPEKTIANFQQTRSLHSMFAQAFGTMPEYEQDKPTTSTETENNAQEDTREVESLDTDSVLEFLTYLGVSQHECHKRIADSLQKELEDELRRVHKQEPLLNSLENVWRYATKVPELRPILWATLKQLGDNTPLPMLQALGWKPAPQYLTAFLRRGLQLRSLGLRQLPPRKLPDFFVDQAIKSYPEGYQLSDIGPVSLLNSLNEEMPES